MQKEILEQDFLALANTPISCIGIYELYWLIDDNLLDCQGIVVCFNDRQILIQSKAVGEDNYTFTYSTFSRDFQGRKILSSTAEPIIFIGKDSPYQLRFQIGGRPLIVTAEYDDIVTVSLSHCGADGAWIAFKNNRLLNDR